ncbi:hypothetical protein RIF29_22958 [Crotalaria pallida]|uniref:Uncharacterized protein n=1 Tax=Crotalaria pallida TaxID=3830 RepID=A0AAN9I9P0_CROPI
MEIEEQREKLVTRWRASEKIENIYRVKKQGIWRGFQSQIIKTTILICISTFIHSLQWMVTLRMRITRRITTTTTVVI